MPNCMKGCIHKIPLGIKTFTDPIHIFVVFVVDAVPGISRNRKIDVLFIQKLFL